MLGSNEAKELIHKLTIQVEVLKEEVRELTSKTSPTVIRGIDGLAKFLGVGKNTAQSMKNDGIIPYYQHGRIVLFKPDEVLEALALQTPKYNR